MQNKHLTEYKCISTQMWMILCKFNYIYITNLKSVVILTKGLSILRSCIMISVAAYTP